jgi:hypothetical protein
MRRSHPTHWPSTSLRWVCEIDPFRNVETSNGGTGSSRISISPPWWTLLQPYQMTRMRCERTTSGNRHRTSSLLVLFHPRMRPCSLAICTVSSTRSFMYHIAEQYSQRLIPDRNYLFVCQVLHLFRSLNVPHACSGEGPYSTDTPHSTLLLIARSLGNYGFPSAQRSSHLCLRARAFSQQYVILSVLSINLHMLVIHAQTWHDDDDNIAEEETERGEPRAAHHSG